MVQNLYLGVDGGGTKTEAVITLADGQVIGRGKSAGSNLHNIPLDIAIENIADAVEQAASQGQTNGYEVDILGFEAACFGLSGLDSKSDRDRVVHYLKHLPAGQHRYHAKRLFLAHDGFIGLKSGTDNNEGICVIASTGSNCYGIKNGTEATAGDWGFLLGDQGSAFAIGSALLRLVIQEYDGRKQASPLTGLVLNTLGVASVPELIPWAYGREVPVAEIASLSRLCKDPEVGAIGEVRTIVLAAAAELAAAYRAVVTKLGLQTAIELPVVLVGGLFGLKEPFTDTFTNLVLSISPGANIIEPTITPAEGAALAARQGLGYLL